jgi:hypothetical protein
MRLYSTVFILVLWNCFNVALGGEVERECCSKQGVGGSALMACVERFLTESFSQHLAVAPTEWLKAGPRLSICLITRSTPEIDAYGAHSLFIKASYAARNGYVLLPLALLSDTNDTRLDYTQHRKLVPLLEALEGPCRYSFIPHVTTQLPTADIHSHTHRTLASPPSQSLYTGIWTT